MNKKFYIFGLLLVMVTGIANSQTWEQLTTGTTYILFDISFPSGQNDVGYAAGMKYTYNAEGVAIKTTDGGDTWSEIVGGAGTDGIEAICFTSVDVGFMAGWNDYFAKTTDGGDTWTDITVGIDNWYFFDMEFWDANNGIAASFTNTSGVAIYVTADGGNTWTLSSGVNHNVQDITYADANTLYAVGGDEKISKSIDGGYTWSEIYSGNYQYFFMGVGFDGNFGVVGGEDGKIMSTIDGGSTWSTYATGYHNFAAVHVFNADSAYIGGTDEDIYKTTDSGNTWQVEDNGSGSSHIYKIKYTDNNTGFLCGSQGMIKRKITPMSPLVANFESDINELCEGGSVNFTDLSTGTPTSWDWTFEGGTPETSSDQNPTVTYNTGGVYDVQLIVSNDNGTATNNIEEMITVFAIPEPVITGDDLVCKLDPGTYIVDYNENSTYEWTVDGGNIISGEGTNEIVVYWTAEQGSTTYVDVTETKMENCEGIAETFEVTIDECVGIEENYTASVKVYPNPAKSILNISLRNINASNVEIMLINTEGRVILVNEKEITNASFMSEMDVNNLSQGIYYLIIKSADNIIDRQKVIIMK